MHAVLLNRSGGRVHGQATDIHGSHGHAQPVRVAERGVRREIRPRVRHDLREWGGPTILQHGKPGRRGQSRVFVLSVQVKQ